MKIVALNWCWFASEFAGGHLLDVQGRSLQFPTSKLAMAQLPYQSSGNYFTILRSLTRRTGAHPVLA
jgi:hypothetical protein